MSDVAGTVIIDVQPDFSGFEQELTQGLKQAAENAQKSAAASFKQSASNIQSVKKETIELVSAGGRLETTLSSIDKTLQKNARSMARLNANIKESTKVAREGSTAFQRLVEIVANLSIVFNAFVQVSDFVKKAGTAAAAADDLTLRFKAVVSLFGEFARRFTGSVGDIERTKKAFISTEKAITKTGRAVTGGSKKVVDYGKNAKRTADTVNKANQVLSSKGKALGDVTQRAVKASKVEKAYNSSVEAGRKVLKKFNSESGAVSLNLLTGGKLVERVSNGFKALGNRVTRTAKTLREPRVVLKDLGKTAVDAGKNIGSALTGSRVGQFSAAVLFGKKSTDQLTGSLRKTAFEAIKTDGVLGAINVTLLRFSRRTDQTSRSLGRLDVISKLSGEALRGTFKKIISSVDNTARAFVRMGNSAGGLVGSGTFFSQLGTFATGIGILAGAATAAGGAFVALAQKASSLNESTNATAVTLGDSNTKFRQLIGNTQELGISQNKLNQSLTPLVPILKSAGLEGDQLAQELDKLVRRGVDLSSIFNEDVGQSLQSVTAAIRGEIEPARRLGISFNAAEVEAKALQLGLEAVDGELSESAKQFTRLQLVLEKSSFAEGDFANTSEELANSQRILGSIIDDTVSKISAAFLPAAKAIIGALTDAARDGDTFTDFFRAVEPVITAIGETIAKLITVFSKFGGTLSKLVVPALEVLGPLFGQLTSLIGGFVAKGITIALFTKTLQTLSIVSAALPANINGISTSVGSLAGISSKLLRPLLLVAAAFTFLGGDIDGTSGALGFLGKGFEKVSGIIQIFLTRALAIKAVGPVLKGLDIALKSVSFDRFSIGEKRIASFTKKLGGIAGAVGIAVGAYQLLKINNDELIGSFEKLEASLKLEGFQKTFAEFIDPDFSPFEKVRIRATETLGRIGGLFQGKFSEFGQIFTRNFEQELRPEIITKRLEEVFKVDPQVAEQFVQQAEETGSEFTEVLKTKLEELKTVASDVVAEVAKTLAELGKTARNELDTAIRAFDTLDRVQQSIKETNQEIQDLLSQQRKIENDIISKKLEEWNATKAVRDAQRQIEDTARERADLEQRILDIEEQRISINKELEDIAKTRKEILDQIAELSKPADADDLIAAQDAVTVARINLNKATREQVKLEEELLGLNEENEGLQVDLTGLSLDEARSKLASARASAAAQRSRKKDTKTSDDLLTDEEKRELSAINTRDAARSLNDAQEDLVNLQNPEITNREKIEDLQENLVSLTESESSARKQLKGTLRDEEDTKRSIKRIDEDSVGLILSKQGAEQDYQRLLRGEIGIQQTIRGISEDVATKRGILKNLIDEETAALELLRQGEQAVSEAVDQRILTRLREKGLLSETLVELQKLIGAEARGVVLNSLRSIVSGSQALQVINEERESIRSGFLRPEDSLEGRIFRPEVVDKITARFLNAGEGADLRQIVKQVLRELNLTVPGFSAEGSVIQGAPGPMGQLMHVGEYSKAEAILPLTKPGRFASVLQQSLPYAHPSVRSMIGQMYQNSVLAPEIGLTGGQSQSLRSRKPSYAGGSVPFESAKPSRLEQKLDRLIQLQEEANSKELGINAPITINESKNPDVVARKTVRELERHIRRNR